MKKKEVSMKILSKLLFFIMIALAILSVVYIYLPTSSFAKEPNCKYGWSYSLPPCKWDYASNCVECTY